ncbi:MAG: Do family serine endopeptidase [Candidatus Omnitrophica bacterium]|nr:Do family serine endopeptidase [Candidatus Omnitrophota bacterium]
MSLLVLVLFIGVVIGNAQGATFENIPLEDATIRVAQEVGKAVVSIGTEEVTKIPTRRFEIPFGSSPFGNDDEMRKFFRDFFGETPGREYKQMGLGSGVIIDAKGYILTNAHVIDNSDKITVTLADGRQFKGEVKGKDKRADLAIVKINALNLPVADLGDSGNLKIGQWVIAIGNPFGFALRNHEPTVTAGVVSALHRSLGMLPSSEGDYNDLVQTDAAINPGNSGGPLVNLKGEVIGINTAIFSTSGGYQGIGFAIPVNAAKRIIGRLIEGKKIIYGWLGVTVQDINEDLAKQFGLSDTKGALVANVLDNSPAKAGGILTGDVIRAINGHPVNDVRELLQSVEGLEVSRKADITVYRQGKTVELPVQITQRPENAENAVAAAAEAGTWRGLKVDDLTPENMQKYQVQEKKGVVVTEVEPGSPADDAGLVAGDVIMEINKAKVNNLSDYQKITAGLKGNVLIRTLRGFLVVKE